jgi:hypothetical protein
MQNLCINWCNIKLLNEKKMVVGWLMQHAWRIQETDVKFLYRNWRGRPNRVNPCYNDIGLYGTSPVEPDNLWYQLIRHS